jgi:hypothetical protein
MMQNFVKKVCLEINIAALLGALLEEPAARDQCDGRNDQRRNGIA